MTAPPVCIVEGVREAGSRRGGILSTANADRMTQGSGHRREHRQAERARVERFTGPRTYTWLG